MSLLSKAEFQATFKPDMRQLGPEARPPFDFWPYYESIPEEHFGGYGHRKAEVAAVYSDTAQTVIHILIEGDTENMFMILVLDPVKRDVTGHILLNASTGEVLGAKD